MGHTVHTERIQHACIPWYGFGGDFTVCMQQNLNNAVFMNTNDSVFKHEVLIQKWGFLKEGYQKKEKCYLDGFQYISLEYLSFSIVSICQYVVYLK